MKILLFILLVLLFNVNTINKSKISHYISVIFFASTLFVEAVARTCSVKKMFIEISQNSQESTCARVSFLIRL